MTNVVYTGFEQRELELKGYWSTLYKNSDLIIIPVGISMDDLEPSIKLAVDLVKNKAILWNEDDQGMTFDYAEIPQEMADQCSEMREYMIEAAAEANDELMEKYLESGELSEAEIKSGLRTRTLANEVVLVLGGSAFKNKGVQLLLDAVGKSAWQIKRQ